jgi:hypothetical protein
MVNGNLFLNLKRIFLDLLCDNSNVRYRVKRETLWPVSRRVRSAETLAVFPNFMRDEGTVFIFVVNVRDCFFVNE